MADETNLQHQWIKVIIPVSGTNNYDRVVPVLAALCQRCNHFFTEQLPLQYLENKFGLGDWGPCETEGHLPVWGCKIDGIG